MSSGIKKLLLLGAGLAHLSVLRHLANNHPADLDVTLITPIGQPIHSESVADVVAGRCTAEQARIAIEPLVQAAHAKWLPATCRALDAGHRQLKLSASAGASSVPKSLRYDWLSIDTESEIDRPQLEALMPGAAGHALMRHPRDSFIDLWPQVLDLARNQRHLSIVVIGAGRCGLETVFAIHERLRLEGLAQHSLSLLTDGQAIAPDLPAGARQLLLQRLRQRNITVLHERCTGVTDRAVKLGAGTTLACDVPVLAIRVHAPAWLRASGLALDAEGRVLVNRHWQSSSHPEVFAVGEASASEGAGADPDATQMPAVGALLAHKLLAAHAGQDQRPHRAPRRAPELLDIGDGQALFRWGGLYARGAWAAAWKARRTRQHLDSLTTP